MGFEIPRKFVSFGHVGPSPVAGMVVDDGLVIVVVILDRIDGRAFGHQHLASSDRLGRLAGTGFIERNWRWWLGR